MKSEQLNKQFNYLFIFNILIVLDGMGQVIEWGPEATNLFGYKLEEIVGQPCNIIFSVQEKKLELPNMINKVIEQGYWNEQLEFQTKDHQTGWIEAIVTLDNRNKGGLFWACRDISQSMEDRQLLIDKAFRDQLTQLGNRRFIYTHLGELVNSRRQTEEKIGVLFLDLDGFKDINDYYGHESGDLVLKEVAVRLQKILRNTDVVARLAGDEFIIILDQLHEKENIKLVYERVINVLKEPIQIDSAKIVVSTSMGCAIFPDDAQTPQDLIRYADLNMYHCKRRSKTTSARRIYLDKDPFNSDSINS